MKYLMNVAIVLLIALSGCMKNEDTENVQQFLDLGIIEEHESGYLITIDTEEIKLLANTLPAELDIIDDMRVSVLYTVVRAGVDPEDFDYLIEVVDIDELLTKELVVIDDLSRDTIGDGPVQFHNVWITQDYLTVNFSFYANIKQHVFNLAFDELEQEEGNVVLSFKHLDNDDLQRDYYSGYMSFKLNSLRKEGQSSVNITFKGLEYYDEEFIDESLVYTY